VINFLPFKPLKTKVTFLWNHEVHEEEERRVEAHEEPQVEPVGVLGQLRRPLPGTLGPLGAHLYAAGGQVASRDPSAAGASTSGEVPEMHLAYFKIKAFTASDCGDIKNQIKTQLGVPG